MAPASLSAGFQPLPPLPTIKLGPSGADSRVGGLVHAVGPCGSLQETPVRPGVSPTAASTPTGVFNQRFQALFPHAGALGCVVCFAPLPFLLVYLCTNVGPRGLLVVALPAPFVPQCASLWVQQPSCCESSLPSCPSPPLLLVWMTVFSFSPWL